MVIFFWLRRWGTIEIQYRNNTVKKLCTDYKSAKKQLPAVVAEKLFSLIELIEGYNNLNDIANVQRHHLHSLQGKREGQYAIDIAGRRSGYRLIITPAELDYEHWKDMGNDYIYKSTKVIIALEVSKHYE